MDGLGRPKSARYSAVSEQNRVKLWEEVKDMYKKLDDIIGEILSVTDQNTYVVLSSDHGAVPLDRFVNLNNLFTKKAGLPSPSIKKLVNLLLIGKKPRSYILKWRTYM